LSITKKPDGSKKTMCLTKMPMHVGMREAANLDSFFFLLFRRNKQLVVHFFFKKKQTHRQQVACHLYNEKQKLIPL
jgi:hypothetical protein